MKVSLVGKNANNIAGLAKNLGLEIVTSQADLIISYGGDGTLLTAEREYPGIPKLPIRDSLICKKCPKHKEKLLLQKMLKREFRLKEYQKLETTISHKTFYALNDFVVRNSIPIHTIRFKVTHSLSSQTQSGIHTNNQLLIGDGIVVSTPFGSTGYFKSITRQTFQKGFAVAFNNTTEKVNPLFLKDQNQVIFKLVRGKATLSFDNSPEIFNLDEGSEITFKLSEKVAKIYEADSLRCPDCVVTRG